MPDVFDELIGQGAPTQELVAQLRKQRALGQLGALSGDQNIQRLGTGVANGAMSTATDLRDRKDKAQAREDQQAFARWQQEQAMASRADDRQFRRDSLAQARALAEQQMANARSIAGLRASAANAASSPFDKARQQKLGTEAAEWDSSGKIQTQAALNDIDQAIGGLKSNKDVGNSKTSWLPFDEKVRAFTDPEGLKIQRLANRVTVENLRNTFGSQFTESEGRAFKALDYDPALSNEDNLANLRKKKAMIESHIRRKNELFGQYRKDALPDFEGNTINTLTDDDIVNAIVNGQ